MAERAGHKPAQGLASARRIQVTGVVQGVGFRPFVYNLARRHGLHGWVRNTSSGVELEVEGSRPEVEAFVRELPQQAPPRSRIERITSVEIAPNGHTAFLIRESQVQPGAYQLISPDIATCDDCLRELWDARDRRHGYPFINCTNCGPRFTIIEDVPYDRPKTTMRAFQMCPECQAEYDDPGNRRFHAQPNACPVCGPHLWLMRSPLVTAGLPSCRVTATSADATASETRDDLEAIRAAAELLKEGQVLGLKGLGGFHLACDASQAPAVQRLRERKLRPHKPFAVMLADMQEVAHHCELTDDEAELLTSPASPIVLLRWRQGSSIAREVAPGNLYLGVMLPYTPLHHLLLREVERPLVMTSGNLSEEPIVQDNQEALRRLPGLADAFLLHDREIYARYDDSVWLVPMPGKPQPARRARGYAPFPIELPFVAGRILACGAELKNTFCLTRDKHAFVSQHIGDMENAETLEHFETSVRLYERLFRCRPETLACDLHPDYLATRYARERSGHEGLPLVCVQHHHAHIASCLADNRWPPDAGPVIGVALDGIGYGNDDGIWGGEFLIAGYDTFQRFGHLENLPLPGGDAATRKPYRIALACLQHFLGKVPDLPFARGVPAEEQQTLRQMVGANLHTTWTSSAGRLFDAVSAVLGVCGSISYEAQAAIELEMIAADGDELAATLPLPIEPGGGAHIVRLGPLFAALVQALQGGQSAPQISAAFHRSLANMILEMCQTARQATGLKRVALSGGCFQNRRLLRESVQLLESAGLTVLVHRQVPCNDGGLSLGQAAVAHLRSGEQSSCA